MSSQSSILALHLLHHMILFDVSRVQNHSISETVHHLDPTNLQCNDQWSNIIQVAVGQYERPWLALLSQKSSSGWSAELTD